MNAYWANKNREREAAIESQQRTNRDESAAEGHAVGSPKSHFYANSGGNIYRYPHGMTAAEWDRDIGYPSFEHAEAMGLPID